MNKKSPRASRPKKSDPVAFENVAAPQARVSFPIAGVEKLAGAEPLVGLLIVVFSEIPAPVATQATGRVGKSSARHQHLSEVGKELLQARRDLQNIRQEMQSTDEGLSTFKAEMRPLNEELEDIQVSLKPRLAGQSTWRDKSEGNLEAERQRTRNGDGQSPSSIWNSIHHRRP